MEKGKRMKKGVVYLALALLVILVLVLLSIPRVSAHETVAFDTVTEADYPALVHAYRQLCGDSGTVQIDPGSEVEVITIENLWGSCEYYVLPCYLTTIGTVPHAGSIEWVASLRLLCVCSDEDCLAARLCKWQVQDLKLRLDPGSNTAFYSFVKVHPLDITYGTPREIEVHKSINCTKNPQVDIVYTVATAASAQDRGEQTSATWNWGYSLCCCGQLIREYQDVALTYDYVVNE